MTPGSSVFHQDYGSGTIIRLYPEGPTAMVDFGYMTDLVPLTKLRSLNDHSQTESSSAEERKAMVTAVPKKKRIDAPPSLPLATDEPKATRKRASPIGSEQPKKLPSVDQSLLETPVLTSVDRSGLASGVIEARRAIVALRLGQVLESHVDALSVGLEDARRQFDDSLEQAQTRHPIYMLVEGAWGQGKTHLLTLLTAAAIRRGFAVSSVVMDGTGVTLTDPMQLLGAVTGAIRFPGDVFPGGLANQLARARRQGNLERLGHLGATILAAVFDQIPSAAFDEFDVLQVIEDYLSLAIVTTAADDFLGVLGYRGIRLPVLRARTVADRADRFCDLLFNWTQLCVVTGARGLVVILDELDVEYASTAGRGQHHARQRERRRELLEALGRLHKKGIPLVLAFASAPASPDIDCEHDASRHIRESVGDLNLHMVASAPKESALRELMTNILGLYRVAYPGAFTGSDQKQVDELTGRLLERYRKHPNPVPRYFVRSALEAMDVFSVTLST